MKKNYKKIAFFPGLSFNMPNYIKKIPSSYKYSVYSCSPKRKFDIGKSGKYFFIPMPFKLLTRLFHFIFYKKIMKNIDIFIYNKICLIFNHKSNFIHANALFGLDQFIKYPNSIKILEESNSHYEYCDEILKLEYEKFNLKFELNNYLRNKRKKEYHLANKIIVPSNFSIKTFLKYGIPKKKLIKSILLKKEFLNLKQKNLNNNNKIVFGYIGGNLIIKGLVYLLEALKEVNYEYTLNLAIPRSYINHYKLIKEKYDESKMNCLGFFKNIDHFYEKIDVLIVPSINDGFAMVVIEALSRSVPVIVSDHVGSSEIITKDFGFVFKSKSKNDLKDILYLINRKKINDIILSINKNFYKIERHFKHLEKNIEKTYVI